jgi:thiamine-monophosphate kinase
MRESELLAHIALRSNGLPDRFPHVLVAPGDDCAVLRTPNADQLLLTTDHLVEGRHFEPIDLFHNRSMLDLIARKAIARSISDIAAMGGTPLCSLATACLPPNFPQDAANQLFDCMHKWAEHWNAPLVGGDISSFAASNPTQPCGVGVPPASSSPASSSLVLTTTVLGTPHKSGAVLRSTAHAGDAVYVTGTLGGSMLQSRHLRFEPRLDEAALLCDSFRADVPRLHAMMDISDGLGRDAARLGRASSLRLELDASLFPCSPGCSWRQALADGEDYELLFTIDPHIGPHLAMPPLCAATGTRFTRIGTVVRPPRTGEPPDPPRPGLDRVPPTGCIVKAPDGAWIDASEMGWEHT